MADPRRSLGAFGERLAASYLESRGYRIRQRNVRLQEGEIDLVAEKDGCLVFVEVRTRRGQAAGTAAESVTPRKQARLLALAEAYLQVAGGDLPPQQRIDVVTVTLATDGRLLAIDHIEGAVEP
ncbi:MAG TPA: YraN family protein [Dehalococcoidia bacterium]|nr:YraN family protein [Dehalococcoidia bacterium]